MLTAIDYFIKSIKSSKSVENGTKSNASRSPCGICHNEVKHNDKALHCTNCLHKVHIRCNGISIDEYKIRLTSNINNPDKINVENWTCLQCNISERAYIFPFGNENSYERNCMNSIDSMKQTEIVPGFEIVSKAMKANNIANDIDEQSIYNVNCKYYSCEEFLKLSNNINSFNLFHSNVNGYECHAENLQETYK